MADGFEIDVDERARRSSKREERARLGLDDDSEGAVDGFGMTVNPFFSAKVSAPRRPFLNGGLTMAHDEFDRRRAAKVSDTKHAPRWSAQTSTSLRFGKEFGNKRPVQPNVLHRWQPGERALSSARRGGSQQRERSSTTMSFLTAGACGPCRFGMYVTEYRKALRDAGFDGFRVLLFQQTGGVKQATGEELGLVLNPTFFWALARAMFSGDVINVLQYRLRPFEIEEGSVDRAIEAVKKEVYDTLADNRNILGALWRGRQILQKVKLDRLRAKPKVSIIGEFWAMTTEGDGSYHIQRFLEQEGAEVQIQVMANVLLYNIWEFRHDTEARLGLKGADKSKFGLADTDAD